MKGENDLKPIHLTFPGSYPTLNKVIANAKKNWGLYATEKSKFTKIAHIDAIAQYRGPVIESQCNFQFNWFLKNDKTDPDNITVGQKYIFDGLVNAGVLKDDGIEILGGGITHFFAVDKDNPRCELTITINAQ